MEHIVYAAVITVGTFGAMLAARWQQHAGNRPSPLQAQQPSRLVARFGNDYAQWADGTWPTGSR
jgi:hypothetical protein